MSLAAPENLIWLLAAVPIIVFYILKTRLRRRQVSTLLFWDQLFQQRRQRTLWQNLRHWLSLLLQLAFVALVGFALADPLWRSQQDQGQDLILVVDNSASMQAVDPSSGQSRLQRAIDQAADVAGTLRQGDQIALITAGTSVRVVVGMSDFAPTVEEALRGIKPTDGPTQIVPAIAAARKLASDSERRRIVVFSDGGIENREMLIRDDAAPSSPSIVAEDLRWVSVGESRDNVAITTFQVRRSTVDPIGYSLLVAVKNFSDQAVDTRLTLTLGEALVDVIPLTIEPGQVFQKQIDSTSAEGGILVGEIKVEDALSVDDTARAILPDRPKIPVRLVTAPESDPYYLMRVLESIPLVELVDESSDSEALLTIYSQVIPEAIPSGPAMFVNLSGDGPAIGDRPAWQLGDAMENPIIAKQEKTSPLLRHVQLQNVVLAGGRDLEINEALGAATTLLETASGARVCASVERPEGRMLFLACDLDSSELPLRIAFPVLMTNAINWFLRETGEIRPSLATGNAAEIVWEFGTSEPVQTATLFDPLGAPSVVAIKAGRAKLGAVPHAGVYRIAMNESEPGADAPGERVLPDPMESNTESDSVDQDPAGREAAIQADTDNRYLVAVNLSDPNESDLSVPEFPDSVAGELPPAGRSPWVYLVIAACVLVLAEWALFQRRLVA